ncbi:MAG TPA: hypothetical protein H9978_07750, partial [Candidatus Corynebacterium faecipullorum]|nr:hypothetical protein [Candidatus Corynebacterium faecipullorum]
MTSRTTSSSGADRGCSPAIARTVSSTVMSGRSPPDCIIAPKRDAFAARAGGPPKSSMVPLV